ncbi:MAG: hypothetical protein L6Q73_14325 [Aquabacterium sp.]|nr:hypothetical protein [Aquabacterium sp.]
MVGWANLSWRDGVLSHTLGYVAASAPGEAGFARALDDELARLRRFLAPRVEGEEGC